MSVAAGLCAPSLPLAYAVVTQASHEQVFALQKQPQRLLPDHMDAMPAVQLAQAAELGKATEAQYQEKRAELVDAIATQNKGVTFRTPRLGVEGCCGRGCNGCQHFWNDPRYARARDLLKGLIVYSAMNGGSKPEKVAAK